LYYGANFSNIEINMDMFKNNGKKCSPIN